MKEAEGKGEGGGALIPIGDQYETELKTGRAMSHHGDAESTEFEHGIFTSVFSVPPWCTQPFRFESSLISTTFWH